MLSCPRCIHLCFFDVHRWEEGYKEGYKGTSGLPSNKSSSFRSGFFDGVKDSQSGRDPIVNLKL